MKAFQIHDRVRRSMTRLAQNKTLKPKARETARQNAVAAAGKYHAAVAAFWATWRAR